MDDFGDPSLYRKPAPAADDDFGDPALYAPPKRQVGVGEALNRGSAAVKPSLLQQGAFLLGLPGAALIDAFRGDHETVDSIGNFIDDRRDEGAALAINPNTEIASTPAKVAYAAPGLVTDLALAFATGGDSLVAKGGAEAAAKQGIARVVERSLETGAKASVLPGARIAVDRAENVTDAGGTPLETGIAATTAYLANSLANAVPGSASGSFGVRAAQGAAVNPIVDRVQSAAEDAGTPDRLGLESQPRTLADDIVSALFGAGLSGTMGERGPERLSTDYRPPADVLSSLLEQRRAAGAPGAPAPPQVDSAPAPGAPDAPIAPERVQAAPAGVVDGADAAVGQADALAARIRAAMGGEPEPAPTVELPPTFPVEPGPAPTPEPGPAVEPERTVFRAKPAEIPPGPQLGMDEARPEPAPRPEPEPVKTDASMYAKGKNAQAVKLDDGTWHVRVRKNGQWQPWEQRATFDPSPAFGYRPHVPQGGVVDIPGIGRRVVGEKSPPRERLDPRRPRHLLEQLAPTGLNREAFRAAGISPDYFGTRQGIQYVFRKDGGLTPDGLREHLQERGFVPPEDPNLPPEFGNNEAVEFLQRALDGERVYSLEDQQAVAEQQVADREAQQRVEAEIADQHPDIADEDHPIARRMAVAAAWAEEAGVNAATIEPRPDETDQAYIDRLHDEIAAKENDDGNDAGATQRAGEVGARREDPAEPAAANRPDQVEPAAAAGGREPADGVAAPAARKEVADETPPAEPAEDGADPSPTEGSTSTKNAVMEAEREAAGRDPIVKEAAKSNPESVAEAEAALKANPNAGREVVQKLLDDGIATISAKDEAILLVAKVDLMAARNRAAARASDPEASPSEAAAARVEWTNLEAEIDRMDQATRNSGREWGRLGQLRQRLIREDHSLEALERKERANRGRPLTAEESATVKKMADEIAALQKRVEAADEARRVAEEAAGTQAAYDSLVKDLLQSLKPKGDRKRPVLERLKASADEARAALAAMDDVGSGPGPKGQKGAVINPIAFVHLTKIGAYHVANGAVKFGDWIVRMKDDLGDKIAKVLPAMRDVHAAAVALHESEKGAKATATPADVVKDIDPANVTHRDVYNLARAHVLAGVKGEGPVMAATHKDLQAVALGITEREVRRLFSDYGNAKFPSKAADKVELREIRALVQLQESIDRLQSGLSALKSGVQRDRATAAIREKRKVLNDLLKVQEAKSGPSPEKLRTYQEARATNLRNQIEDLERQIATGEKPTRPPAPEPNEEVRRLTQQRDALRKQLDAIEAANKPRKSPEERYQETRAKSLQKQLAEVKARIAAGNYAPAPKRQQKVLSPANENIKFELAKAKHAFAKRQFEIAMENRPVWRKAIGSVKEAGNFARAIMTSLDLSAVLRQGGFIVFGHPLRAASSVIPMLRAFGSPEAAFKVDDEIANRPNFPLYKKAGLHLSETDNHLPSKMEEAFMSRWLERMVPPADAGAARKILYGTHRVVTAPLRGSQRAFTTFLNKLRADSFDAMLETLSTNKVPTEAEAKAVANYVNIATGRGKIGSNPNTGAGLSTVFFAPKLVASRFNLLAGQPMYGGSMRTRGMIAAEYARFLTGIAATIGLASLAHDPEDGPFTTFDPRSSDFLKMRFGKTFIDPMAGLAQVTTFVAREVSGEKVTTKGKLVPLRDGYRYSDMVKATSGDPLPYGKRGFGTDDGYDILSRFARTKLAPLPGAAVNLLTGTDVTGGEVTPEGTALGLVTPLSMRDIGAIMQEHGVPAGTAIEMLNLLGMGVQHRSDRSTTSDSKDARQ